MRSKSLFSAPFLPGRMVWAWRARSQSLKKSTSSSSPISRRRLHLRLPGGVDGALVVLVGDVGQHVALEHLRQAQREPAVVHGLEDGVGVLVGVRLDRDQVDVLQQPVDEERAAAAPAISSGK